MPSRKTVSAAVCAVLAMAVPAPVLAKPLFVEPDEGPDPRGLTVSGSGLARVDPPRRATEESIGRAVGAVTSTAEARAMRDARRRALGLARAAGLTLGAVQAVKADVSDADRFGPVRYCHRARCTVPPFATASIRVTYATAETSMTARTGRAVVASGSGSAPVRPRRMRSPAIRAALRRARPAADSAALVAALRGAAAAADAAGLRREALFSLAEEPRLPFSQDILSGTFGPGRFCGTIRRFRYVRDPDGGRPRRVPGRPVRRCYVPGVSSVFRVTFAAG